MIFYAVLTAKMQKKNIEESICFNRRKIITKENYKNKKIFKLDFLK
jgi:hypothetical protein